MAYPRLCAPAALQIDAANELKIRMHSGRLVALVVTAARRYSAKYCAGMASGPADFLASAPLGTRVVARYRISGGFTDALGYLRSCNGTDCVIQTRRSLVTVTLVDVVAAKAVPEPPARRGPRSAGTAASETP